MNKKHNKNSKKYKWRCFDCGYVWFSNIKFEDLCPNVLCESDLIFYKKTSNKKECIN